MHFTKEKEKQSSLFPKITFQMTELSLKFMSVFFALLNPDSFT